MALLLWLMPSQQEGPTAAAAAVLTAALLPGAHQDLIEALRVEGVVGDLCMDRSAHAAATTAVSTRMLPEAAKYCCVLSVLGKCCRLQPPALEPLRLACARSLRAPAILQLPKDCPASAKTLC